MKKIHQEVKVFRKLEDLKLEYSNECQKKLEKFQKQIIKQTEAYKKKARKILEGIV